MAKGEKTGGRSKGTPNKRTAEAKEVVEFKLWDKISALEKIGRHLGIFEKDNSQNKPEVAQPFTDSQVDWIIANLRNETCA